MVYFLVLTTVLHSGASSGGSTVPVHLARDADTCGSCRSSSHVVRQARPRQIKLCSGTSSLALLPLRRLRGFVPLRPVPDAVARSRRLEAAVYRRGAAASWSWRTSSCSSSTWRGTLPKAGAIIAELIVMGCYLFALLVALPGSCRSGPRRRRESCCGRWRRRA